MSSTLSTEWKLEPVSPLSSEETQVSDDVALYGVQPPLQQYHAINIKGQYAPCESKFEIASKVLDDLEHLDNLDDFIKDDFDEWIKDEPFSNWLEEKMLPILFEDTHPISFSVPAKYEPPYVPDTPSLLQEFENVFGAVEMARGTLTPPQSPPYPPQSPTYQTQPILTTLEPLVSQPYPANNTLQYPSLIVPQNDVAQELAIVDELIRTRAENLINYPPSPGSASFSSSSSNFGDYSSDDPEWIPETVERSPTPDFLEKPRKRSKPYSRPPPEDKKVRKKEQNKNAATRYRMKKKAEVEVVLEEERLLIKENDGLEDKISDMQREIKYLKGLMRDLFKAKGLIN